LSDILDEVQMLDCFESVLNGYLRKENMDVYVTGSNAKFFSKDIITEFAGRGDEIHMYPLSFSEFMSVYKGDKYEGLSEYMLYGGIPLLSCMNLLMTRQRYWKICLRKFISGISIRGIRLKIKES